MEEGAAVEAVDQALLDFGMAMGPLAMGDMVGLDVLYHGREGVREAEKKAGLRSPLEDRLYDMMLGPKVGRGLVQVR